MSWTANLTEQGHVSASGPLKSHRSMGAPMACARSLLVQSKPVLAGCALDHQIDRLEIQSNKLANKNPNKFTGRQLYFGALQGEAKKMAEGREMPHDIRLTIMRMHGSRYNALTNDNKAKYAADAEAKLPEKWKRVHADQAECRQSLKRLKTELSDHRRLGPLRVSSCVFSSAEVQQLEDDYASGRLTHEDVSLSLSARDVAQSSSPAVIAALESMDISALSAAFPKTRTAWDRQVAYGRQFFQNCVFKTTDEHGDCYMQLFAALQNPIICGFVEVRYCLAPDADTAYVCDKANYSFWKHRFERLHNTYVYSDEWPYSDELYVLTGCLNVGSGMVVSSASWKPIAEVAAYVSEVPEAQATATTEDTGSGGSSKSGIDLRYEECPWLSDWLKTPTPKTGSGDRSGPTRFGAFEVDSMAVMNALCEARAAWEASAGEVAASSDFTWSIRGGDWCMANFGVPYDCFAAEADNDGARSFCVLARLVPSSSYHLSVFGDEGAFAMCSAWCNRMQFMYDKYCETGAAGFGVGVWDDYIEPAGVAAILAARGSVARVERRVNQLRALKPMFG
jgi:hypothetical protein